MLDSHLHVQLGTAQPVSRQIDSFWDCPVVCWLVECPVLLGQLLWRCGRGRMRVVAEPAVICDFWEGGQRCAML